MKSIVAYHGTNRRAAKSIMEKGFRVGSFFSYELKNALRFGGPCVFKVELSSDPELWKGEPDGWQFHLSKPLSPDHIVLYKTYPGIYEKGGRKTLKGPDGCYVATFYDADLVDIIVSLLNARWNLPKTHTSGDRE